jgi:hypothetical protein
MREGQRHLNGASGKGNDTLGCHRRWHRRQRARFSREPSASPISHQANTSLEMHNKQRAPKVETSTTWTKPRRAKHQGTNFSRGPMESKRGEGRRSETRSLQGGEPRCEEDMSEKGGTERPLLWRQRQSGSP